MSIIYTTNKKAKEKAKSGINPFAKKSSGGCDSAKCSVTKADTGSSATALKDKGADSGK